MRLLLTTPYDLAVPGGVNRHALDLLDVLTARGHTVRLVGPASEPAREADPRLVHLGRVWVGSLNGARSRVTLDPSIGGAVGRLVREFRPDVIHLQDPFLPLLNTWVLWHRGAARCVGTFHTYSETSRGYLWTWPWCRWCLRRVHVRIAVSAAARDFAARYHPAEYHVVPNGLRFPPAAVVRPARPPGRPVRVIFVGRADEPRKGFGILQAALQRLEAESPGAFVLDAVGRGTPRGEVGSAELAAAWAAADVCAVPSLGGESFGLVPLEALAHGVPVVASAIRGYADWLGKAAVLVPPGDAAALAGALRAATADPEEHARRAREGRRWAADYDWERIVERLLTLYAGSTSNEPG
jgi:phosphatidylinositol alpha-mannosyltransferase